MSFGGQSFIGMLVSTAYQRNKLRVTFVFKEEKEAAQARNEHVYRYMRAKVGSSVTFKVVGEEVTGVIDGVTEIQTGGSFSRYKNAEFSFMMIVPSKTKEMRIDRYAASAPSAIVGVEVPTNIQSFLPLSDSLEYEPHITVAHFPSITKEEGKEVEGLIEKAAGRVGSFDVRLERSFTFPNQQKDGTYPWVALAESQGLMDFHDTLLDLLEYHLPGLASTEFIHKNFNPHVTLEYVKTPVQGLPITPVIWTVGHVTLNAEEPPVKIELHRHRKTASVSPHLQIGDVTIPVKVKSDKNNHLKVRIRDTRREGMLEGLENDEITFATQNSERLLSVIETKNLGRGIFDIYYRVTSQKFPSTSKKKLSYVRKESESRGALEASNRIAKLLDFSEQEEKEEPEDVDAFGPGSPGTFSDIATYSKSVQSEGLVDPEAKTFQKAQDLVDRI